MRPYLIGLLVLLARMATLPRTPWDAAELRFPFVAMVAISVLASVATAIALAAKDPLASLLFSISAAVMVHAPAARLDALGWMFVALALLCLRKPVLLGAFAAAAMACGIVSALALFIAALILIVTERRDRFLAAIAFVIVLLPFVTISESVPAPLSFSIARFTLHPWGSKFVALPVFIAVVAGIRPLIRKWSAELEVLMWFALVHVAFGIAFVDPADGVRYAVPSLMFTAFVAAEGLRALRVTWIGAAVIAALSIWYAFPILRDRVTRPSPPIEAARAIPSTAVVLHDRETAAFAKGVPLDEGLRRHVDDDVPLLHFAYGNSNEPGARGFSRPDHDAYGKLTRNAYRNVSLIPIPQRYAPLDGVFGIERNESGESWRWLEREATVRVPTGRAMARVTLRLPADAPFATNDVQINATHVTVRRGESVVAPVPLEQPLLLIRASRVFPLAAPDTRRVSVQLIRMETR
ncbi:MAG TPA: hypothetical protein VGQ36_12985 [Thermoanaerobaculia bacterium]|jgi:hypothetical protein|nr:hypothetical protein [Thermoanaerobaculia bacterium]